MKAFGLPGGHNLPQPKDVTIESLMVLGRGSLCQGLERVAPGPGVVSVSI